MRVDTKLYWYIGKYDPDKSGVYPLKRIKKKKRLLKKLIKKAIENGAVLCG
jgi:hypothetical protein